MYDFVFQNALIVDGSGEAAYQGAVAVSKGKIAKIADKIEEHAGQVIDCKGMVLAPGFIDSHSHSDLFLMSDPGCGAKLCQGVTTEIAGQCGLTVAPVSACHYEERNMKSMVASFMKGDRRAYTSTKLWYDYLDSHRFGTNQMSFIGQGTVRETVMGYADGPADEAQLEEMKCLVREAMELGALGLSSGLAYSPGNFTPHEEIVELCKVVAEYGGIYVTHMRNQAGEMLRCVADTIDVARKTGCKACISHIKCIGKPNWGSMEQAIGMLRAARAEGIEIWCDIYPYTAGATTLTVTLPPSLLEGGKEKLVERLGQPETREYIRRQFEHPTEQWENAVGENGLDSFLVAVAPATPQAVGKRITEYARELGLEPFDAYIKLLVDNHASVMTVNFVMSEADLSTAISQDFCLIGSDGVFNKGDKVTHPRSIGTFPRFLARYARDQKLFSLEQAVEKITGRAARCYGLDRRKGYVREGFDADLVVFDWEQIMDTADFSNTLGQNTGIAYVMVGGSIAVDHNNETGLQNGVFIHK